MSIDAETLAEWKAIAEAATPGPWAAFDGNEGIWPPRPSWMVANDAFHNPPDDEDAPWLAVELHTGIQADAAHIATFDPPTVLALIADAEESRDRVEFLEQDFEHESDRCSEHFEALQSMRAARDALQAQVDAVKAILARLRGLADEGYQLVRTHGGYCTCCGTQTQASQFNLLAVLGETGDEV